MSKKILLGGTIASPASPAFPCGCIPSSYNTVYYTFSLLFLYFRTTFRKDHFSACIFCTLVQ